MSGDDTSEASAEVAKDDAPPTDEKAAPKPKTSEDPAADVVAMSDAKPATDEATSDGKPTPDEASTESESAPTDVSNDAAPTNSEPGQSSGSGELSGQDNSERSSFASRRMLTYGLGFGAVAIGILLAGLALVLRRS